MASIRTLFDTLIALEVGEKITIGVEDRNEYETVRTRLVRFWMEHKEVIEAIGDSSDPVLQLGLCGDYDGGTGLAEFYVGKPRRKMAKQYSFSISVSTVDDDKKADGTTGILP